MPATPITFAVKLDGTPEQPIELIGYLFDSRGQLIASAPVRDGNATFHLEPERLVRARLFIAPRDAHVPPAPTLAALRRVNAYEPPLRMTAEVRTYTVPAILPELWRRWILCICRVPGRVVRPVEISGHVLELPVHDARVHVCEVDPWPILLARIPDLAILKIRDEILRARPPTPPPPERVVPRLPMAARLSFGAYKEPEALNRLAGLDLSPEHLDELAATQPELVAEAVRASAPAPAELPAAVRTGLAVASAAAVREAFERHIEVLRPWFCLIPRIWPFLRTQEVFTGFTDEHGRFEARILYPCHGDKPDIYVWVDYSIGGAFTPVYKPPVACTTRWNYPCGQELVVRVRDSRVPWSGEPQHMPAAKIGVITVGNAVNVSELGAEGLARDDRPLGGSLEPTVWFGPDLLTSGITHYRWSYRRLSDAGAALEDWHACDAFVGRHYAVVTPDHHLVFKVAQLGPDVPAAGGALFKIPPKDPPEGTWVPQANARSNTASAYFLTGQPSGRLVPDGLYQLKLELFRVAGATVTQATNLDFQVPPPGLHAPFSPEHEIAFQAPPEANLVRDAGGHVVAYTMRLRVDNSPCTAGIYSVAVPGSTQECGFVTYPVPPTTATLRFFARHPRGYADFDFSVWRGSCRVAAAGAAGKTGDTPVHGYVLDAAAVYGHAFSIGSLLAPLPEPGCAQLCTRAAFAEHLHVYARATDGWSYRLEYLDAHAVAAFALAPKD